LSYTSPTTENPGKSTAHFERYFLYMENNFLGVSLSLKLLTMT